MGLLSKLLGGSDKDLASGLNKLKKFAEQFSSEEPKKTPTPSYRPDPAPAVEPVYEEEEEGPSGESWGPRMPAEANQFNSGKSFDQYFEEIFRSEFAGYGISKEWTTRAESWSRNKRVVFTFVKDGRKALVVEVMSDRSNAQALRRECRRAGTPYLRYYYDHEGWWNTRSYVIRRTREALPF